jgi:menaquinone-dependent protoporphyrinogen IX oxidase
MDKTLIVYGTRYGTTVKTVLLIAEILGDKFSHTIEISDTKQIKHFRKRIHEFDHIIIGSSIVSGLWKRKVLNFAKRDIFKGKNVAIFVTAGGTMNKVEKYGIKKEEVINEAIEKYIDKYSGKFRFKPISKIAFGGKVIKREEIKYNSWDKEDIINWTVDLGNKMEALKTNMDHIKFEALLCQIYL